jgi:hypothetical protein
LLDTITVLCLAREHETFTVGFIDLEINGPACTHVTDRNRLAWPWIHNSALDIAPRLDLNPVHASCIAGRGNQNPSARLESPESNRGR